MATLLLYTKNFLFYVVAALGSYSSLAAFNHFVIFRGLPVYATAMRSLSAPSFVLEFSDALVVEGKVPIQTGVGEQCRPDILEDDKPVIRFLDLN